MTFEEQYAKMIKDQLGTLLIDYIDQRDGKKVINDKTHQYKTMKSTMDEFVQVKKRIADNDPNSDSHEKTLRKVKVNFQLVAETVDSPS